MSNNLGISYLWEKVSNTVSSQDTLIAKTVRCNLANTMDSGSSIQWSGGTQITSSRVTNAVWNDYADMLDVPEDLEIIPGRCYCYSDGRYRLSGKYMDSLCLGICSDTYGFCTGGSVNKNHLPLASSGFTLAYVDREYPAGTPLVCTENGCLTQLLDLGIPAHSYEVVALYWKPEPEELVYSGRVTVNGRHWVKIR